MVKYSYISRNEEGRHMKAIILAAGYATRLYPLTKNQPKALLPLGKKPIIEYIIEQIEMISEVNEIIIISNHKFYQNFVEWNKESNFRIPIAVLDDHTTDDDDKLGAIGDIQYVIDEKKIEEDILIVAGDNYFTFDIKEFYAFYKKTNSDCILAEEIDDIKTLQRFAVAVLEENGRVIDLEEKPQEPKSNTGVYASYFYKKETLPRIKEYLDGGNNPDAPGYFPAWLYKKQPVFAYRFDGECIDIGTVESYEQAQNMFKC